MWLIIPLFIVITCAPALLIKPAIRIYPNHKAPTVFHVHCACGFKCMCFPEEFALDAAHVHNIAVHKGRYKIRTEFA